MPELSGESHSDGLAQGAVNLLDRLFSGYKIIEDKFKKDFILQKYNGSQIGWSYIRTFPTLEKAERWILDGIKKE